VIQTQLQADVNVGPSRVKAAICLGKGGTKRYRSSPPPKGSPHVAQRNAGILCFPDSAALHPGYG
jgi:hypothetical protein